MYQYIVIEGNIGAGKTSLATRLAGERNASLLLEQFEENLFLPRFYEDPARFAFPLELSFLADRFQQLNEHFAYPDLFTSGTIADYFIYKSLIFASRNLDSAELTLYKRMFELMTLSLPQPDLLVFLYLPVNQTKQNIIKRGRDYEQRIGLDYLEKIQTGYLDFLRQLPEWRILLVDTHDVDFVNRDEDYAWMADLLNRTYPRGLTQISR